MAQELPGPGRELRACQRYQSPYLLILSRSAKPPIPRLTDDEVDEEKTRDEEASAGEGTKREIRGMSRQSSKNLSRLLSILDWEFHGRCVHVTLTYARVFPRTKIAVSREKQVLAMWFARNARCGVWRLEFQVRGAPHWHLLVWLGDVDSDVFTSRVTGWWSSRKLYPNSSEYGCHVTSGDQVRGRWYLAMHAAKRVQAEKPPFFVGRWWGYIERDILLKAADVDSPVEVHERELVWWKRLYRRQTGCTTRNEAGITWFLPRAVQCAAAAWIRDRVEDEKRQRFKPKNPF